MNSPSLDAVALLALMKVKGIGRRGAIRIVDTPRDAADPKSHRDIIFGRAERAKISPSELSEAWRKSEQLLEQSATSGIEVYSLFDGDYPTRLRTIPDPPALLFVKGETGSLRGLKSVAIVGTREPTSYGAAVARRSGETSAEAGYVVVSGLAHGCDAFGHEGCLDANGIGIAVMAHGLDKVYPAANRGLAARLLENGGCLVSEYPVGVTPMRSAFAERDRIQSGLSDGVLVIETDFQGGTMHTVRFSREQQRPLACVEHPKKWLCEEKTQGNQKLIADGWATPIPDGPALVQFLARIATQIQTVSPPPEDESASDPMPAQRSLAF